MTAPIERKVAAGSATGIVTGAVAWILTTYVFHGAIPLPLDNLINFLVPVALGGVAMYFTKHTPREVAPVEPKPPAT